MFDSLSLDGRRVGGTALLTASANDTGYSSWVRKMTVERQGRVCAVVRVEGVHRSADREWLPFVVRLYFYAGSEQVRMVHTFVYDGDQQRDMITSLGIRLKVPMRQPAYNQHVAFATGDGGVWAEPVQVLEAGSDRSRLRAMQMAGSHISADDIPPRARPMLADWAQWDGYRLSQLADNSFSIRKRATAVSPWLGTLTGVRSPGYAFVGDTQGGLGVALKDFWQS